MKDIVFEHQDMSFKAPKNPFIQGLNEKKIKSFTNARLQAKKHMDTIAFETSLSKLKKRGSPEKELSFELEFSNQSLLI